MGVCIRCGVEIPSTGKRGRPASYCAACKPPRGVRVPSEHGADLSPSVVEPLPSDPVDIRPKAPPVFPEEPDKWGDDW